MNWLTDFHFLRPYFLICLFFPLFLSWRLWKNERVQSSWAAVCDENLLNYLLIRGTGKQRRIPIILAILISFILSLAIAGPTWHKKDNPALSVDNPVMIMLNMSSDMWVKDVSPSRIVRAKYLIKDLLSDLHTSEIGMMVYTREPFIITPMTEDPKIIDNLLPAVDGDIMPENGDRMDRAIELAVRRLEEVGYSKGNLVILTSDVGERFDAALSAAQEAATKGFDINIIKVSASDSDKLQMVAEKGNGKYLNYTQKMTALTDKINNIFNKELKQSKNMQSVWEDAGYFFLWLPALLMLFYFRKGVLAVVVLLMLTSPTHAGMFLNNNQEGLRYFKSGNYEKAMYSFDDAQWKGAAAYKNGNFEQAYEAFSGASDTTSLYNQGNALAKSGKINEAIQKYEEVLQQDPDFEDARFNLEYLKKQQQNQQQKQDQQKQSQDNQKQQQNKQDNQDKQENSDKDSEKQQQNEEQQSLDNTEEQQSNSSDTTQQQNQNEEQKQQKQQQQQQEGKQEAEQLQRQQDQQNHSSDEQPQQNDQQQGQDQVSPASKQQTQQEGDSAGSGNDRQSPPQGTSSDDDEKANAEAMAEKQVAYGKEDESSDQEAEALQTQAGGKIVEDKEKIRARLQKFREIPEDKGGLLKAFIEREYRQNRYNDD